MNHPATTAQTVAALRRIRELWGDLLVAIETPATNDVWPPRQLAHTLRPPANEPDDDPATARLPLVLREYPAPVNLAALDAGREIEEALFDLADILAAACQQLARDDPRRWHIRTETSPGSRRHGLHWAAVWIEGRVQGEDTEPELEWDGSLAPSPFRHLSGTHQMEARRTARGCEYRLLRLLGLDERATPIPDRPCPWCAGCLILHTSADTPPAVSCATGPDCTAPVFADDRGRRVWRWRDLPHLSRALDAAGQRVEAR
jgi:hypothetical protein